MSSSIEPEEQAVHELLDPLFRTGILTHTECDGLCKEIIDLLRFIHTCEPTPRGVNPEDHEPFWKEFQKKFGFGEEGENGVVPMNAANLCPEPTALLKAANTLRLAYNKNVAQQVRMAGGERVGQLNCVRRLLASGLGLDPSKKTHLESLAIVRNASEANNAINAGFRSWSTGGAKPDNVVLWSGNHMTNLAAWYLRQDWARRQGQRFNIDVVELKDGMSDDDILEEFTSKIGPNTRFVSYSLISNASGFMIPKSVMQGIYDYVEDPRKNWDCHIHVDGTMAWGAQKLDLDFQLDRTGRPIKSPPFHSIISSAHKWFLGPKETGMFWMRPDKVKKFLPSIFGYDYKIHDHDWHDLPKSTLRFELLGQRDDVNIITLGMTQCMWNALEKSRNPYGRVKKLAKELMSDLGDHGWKFVTPQKDDRHLGVVRIEAVQGSRDKSLYNFLYEDKGISGSGDKNNLTFRLCPHIYNTEQDLTDARDGMNSWRKPPTQDPTLDEAQ